MNRTFSLLIALVLCAPLGACKDDEPTPPATEPRLSIEELKNPETCEGCHPTHYREWKASMHAYAADDPVFVAMNALGQEETNGELGDFCVNCHAPMAVREGMTDGGVLAEDTPQHLKGVTCYFCHNVESVEGANNAVVTLANDDVMRGTLQKPDPIEPSAHGVRFSSFLDRNNPKSSDSCGGCHDLALKNGVHLERTFAEYKETIFADRGSEKFQSCVNCHMPRRDGPAAMDDGRPDDGVTPGEREVHSHLWPGVDVALTDWPDRELYEAAVVCALDTSINVRLDADETGPYEDGIRYMIETGAGHNMPSGASQDRRLWVEMIAYDAQGEIVCSRGAVPDDVAVTEFVSPDIGCTMTKGQSSPNDPVQFPLFRDRIFDEMGNETHMFWRAAPSDVYESGVLSRLMPGATMVQPDGEIAPHTIDLQYGGLLNQPVTRVTVRLKMRPMDYDVLEELIDTGYLDESIRDEIRTFTLDSASVDYELEDGAFVAKLAPERSSDCYAAFFCAFEPDAPLCD